MTEPNEYLGSLDADELQEEQEFFDNHWANDLLDAPHALIAVIETKIARAVIAREREIIKLLEDYIPTFYQLSPNSDACKYPIEHLIELIKVEQK